MSNIKRQMSKVKEKPKTKRAYPPLDVSGLAQNPKKSQSVLSPSRVNMPALEYTKNQVSLYSSSLYRHEREFE